MKLVRTLLLFAALAFAANVQAGPDVGTDAPSAAVSNWVMNAPEGFDGSNLKGQVTLVELWGINCGPCMRLVPHLIQLHEKYGKKGLAIVASERQNHSAEEIKAKLGPMGVTYPVTRGEPSSYQGNGGIPHGWIIGVDGKVLWEGNPGGANIDKIIEDEIAKISYPGLGKLNVAKGLEKSASKFVANDMATARDEATKAMEKATKKATAEDGTVDESKLDDDDKAVIADAKFILEKVTERATTLKEKATSSTEAGEYKAAHDAWKALEDQFGKADEGVEGKEKVKEMLKDKTIKGEIKASEALEKLLEGNGFKNGSDKKKNALLKDFAKSNKDTKAAAIAEGMMTSEE